MLDVKPEKFEDIKARFPDALEEIDIKRVLSGKETVVSQRRSYVFDFEDGMRMIVSIDKMDDVSLLHVSASGTEEYGRTIRNEGLEGIVEDVVLRLYAMIGHDRLGKATVMITEGGVLHLIFKEHEL